MGCGYSRAGPLSDGLEIRLVVGVQHPVPDGEIEDHQTDVEFEAVGVADQVEHAVAEGINSKRGDLLRSAAAMTSGGSLEVVAEQGIGLESFGRLEGVADRAHRHRAAGEVGREVGFLAAFLDQVVASDRSAGWPPATILSNLPGSTCAVERPGADPEEDVAAAADVAVEVDAVSAEAEARHQPAVDAESFRVAPAVSHCIQFAPRFAEPSAVHEAGEQCGHGLAAVRCSSRMRERAGKRHAASVRCRAVRREHRRESPAALRRVPAVNQPSCRPSSTKRHEAREIAAVAGTDAVEKAHEPGLIVMRAGSLTRPRWTLGAPTLYNSPG